MRVFAVAPGVDGSELTGFTGAASGSPGMDSVGAVGVMGRAAPAAGSFKKIFTPRFSGSGSVVSSRRLSWRRYSTASLIVVCRNSMFGMVIALSLRWIATVP